MDGVGNAAAVSVINAGNISGNGSNKLISAISQAKTDGNAGSVTVTSNGQPDRRQNRHRRLIAGRRSRRPGGVAVSSTGNIVAARRHCAGSSAERAMPAWSR